MKKRWKVLFPILTLVLLAMNSLVLLFIEDYLGRETLGRQAVLQSLKIQQLFLDRHWEQMDWLAQRPELLQALKSPGTDRQAILGMFRTAAGISGIDVVYATDTQGKIVLASREDFTGVELGQRSYVINALKGVSGVFLGKGVATHSRGIYMAVPIRDGEKVVGALAYRVAGTSLDKLFFSETASFVETSSGEVFSAANPEWIYGRSHPDQEKDVSRLGLYPLDWSWDPGDRTLRTSGVVYRAVSVVMGQLDSSRLWVLERYTAPWWLLTLGNLILLALVLAISATLRYASLSRQRRWQVEQAEHLRSLFENSLAAMATFSRDGVLTWANASFIQLTQPLAIIRGRPFRDLWAKDLRVPWKEVMDGQRPWLSFDGFFKTRQDWWIPVSAGLSVVQSPGGDLWNERTYLLTVLDMSERNEVEEALKQSQKLASLGQLAGGIAHDFNNILGSLSGMAELIKASLADDDSLQESVDILISGFAKASALAEKLLNFARQSPRNFEILDLRNLLKDLKFFGPSSRSRSMHMFWDLPDEPLWVRGDSGLLTSVFLNLAVNAADAMPQGGDLRIGARVEKDKVVVHLKDNGHGISPENLHRIFEPFFTTKGSQGTGLGLALAKRTVVEHKGNLSVESALGEGTTMVVKLPYHPPEKG